MNIYIPSINFNLADKRQLFIATRPFFLETSWGNNSAQKTKWNVTDNYVDDINKAQVLFIPDPINNYSIKALKSINELCKKHNIKGYGYITGDYGCLFPNFDSIVYFRVGGFTQQLPENNIGLPVALSDIFENLYKDIDFEARNKQELPNIGFCGHASMSFKKRFKDKLVFAKKNVFRFFQNPFRIDYETLFASAYERFRLLKTLENSSKVKTNFIYRKKYRAGATTKEIRIQTNKEYYENIRQSDYVLCVRGSGNFSVRFYETLMMGRIPIFIDTNCLLPFVDQIDWEKHMVLIPWKKRHEIARIVSEFHNSMSEEEFKQLQHSNRSLWKNSLSVSCVFQYIRKKTIKE